MLLVFLSVLSVGWNVLTRSPASGKYGVLEPWAIPFCWEDGAGLGASGQPGQHWVRFHMWCRSLPEREGPWSRALMAHRP